MPDAALPARSDTRRRCAPDWPISVGLVAGFIGKALSTRRPCERRDPYAVPFHSGTGVETFCNNQGQWLWVPASAGTTIDLSRVRSRTALRQIVVGVNRFRFVFRLGLRPAIFDHQIDRVGHVLVGHLE